MTSDRYPSDLIVTVQDFEECHCDTLLATVAQEGYFAMWQALSKAAKTAMDENRLHHGKVFWMLADACSMALSPESHNEPFKPFMMLKDRRSTIPDDFSDQDITFFSEVVDAIDDARLKARLADLVWLKQRPRNVQFAITAIDAYRSIPLDAETWLGGGQDCWARAISLTLMLGKGAGSRLTEMKSALLDAINSATKDSGFLAVWLSDLLDRHGLARSDALTIAQKLCALAIEFDRDKNFHFSRGFFDAARRWFDRSNNEAKSAEMTVAVAEGWVQEAIARVSSDQPSHMVAANFYEKAIQIYRSIPHSQRSIHRVDERIAELYQHLNTSGARSIEELGVITSPEVDISMLIENARQAVRGKSIQDALFSFANIYKGARVDQARESAKAILEQSIFRRLAGSTYLSRDGRVIAKQPASEFGEEQVNDDPALWAQMLHDYQILINIVVHGDILPAYEMLLQEHRLREEDFIYLARQSPIVPQGRERLFGKALYAGFDGDFTVAIHLLAPQIEHMVRFHLKNVGVKTTNLNSDGIETENGLSTLMDLPETEAVFGKDLCFEIKALFCDALGPNLRNELAHGLLDDDSFQSIFTMYAWWMGLRLVCTTFWNAARKAESKEKERDGHD